MTVINTNTAAIRAGNASRTANMQLQSAMERLSTGKRINAAKDDAAGLAISQSMSAQIRGMTQSVRNANDGISLAQTAEGSLNEVSNMLQRIRELGVQSASGTYSVTDRDNMQAEVTQLTSQIKDVLGKASFNGVNLFGSTDKTISIQIGANTGDTVGVKISGIDTSTLDADFNVSAGTSAANLVAAQKVAVSQAETQYNTDLTAFNTAQQNLAAAIASGTGVTAAQTAYNSANYNLNGGGTRAATARTDTTNYQGSKAALDAARLAYSTEQETANTGAVSNANSTLANVDEMLNTVSTVRAGLGAAQSRLESVVNDLTTNMTNLSDARSRIEDTDYSAETAQLAKAQILSQASTAMLAQANQSQQGVLKLLG